MLNIVALVLRGYFYSSYAVNPSIELRIYHQLPTTVHYFFL